MTDEKDLDNPLKYRYVVFSEERLQWHGQDEVMFKTFAEFDEAKEWAIEMAARYLRSVYRVYELKKEWSVWLVSSFDGSWNHTGVQ